MASNPYDPAIADIEARIPQQEARVQQEQKTLEDLKSLLVGLKKLRTESSAATIPAVPVETFVLSQPIRVSIHDITMARDIFAGMTIAEAAKKYLEIGKVERTTQEIADALERGGLTHSSLDFATTVRGTLAAREEFMRINDVWALTAWHPELNKGQRPTKKLNIGQRIMKAMGSEPGSVWLPRRMAVHLGANLNTVQSIMSSMAQDGQLSKEPRGYSLPRKSDVKTKGAVAILPTLKGPPPPSTIEQDGVMMSRNLAEYVLKVHGPRLPLKVMLTHMAEEGWVGYGSQHSDMRNMHEILKRDPGRFRKTDGSSWELVSPAAGPVPKPA